MTRFDFKSEKEERRIKFIEVDPVELIEEGRRFREIREALNITRREVCALMGVPMHTIARFEAGKPIVLRELVIKSYTKALNSCAFQLEKGIRSLRDGWLDCWERPPVKIHYTNE